MQALVLDKEHLKPPERNKLKASRRQPVILFDVGCVNSSYQNGGRMLYLPCRLLNYPDQHDCAVFLPINFPEEQTKNSAQYFHLILPINLSGYTSIGY